MRLVWMVLPPIMGTRKMVAATTLLLCFPVLGWGGRSMSPDAPYWELVVLAFLAISDAPPATPTGSALSAVGPQPPGRA